MSKFTYIDLFSGIGGFAKAMRDNGGECIHFSEIDKTAIDTYCINLNEDINKNLGDIKKIKTLPNCNILTAGVPCQSWSTAGKKLGFGDERGQLWNDTIYLLNQSKPDAFIFENVKGLADPRNKKALEYILNGIKEAGYYANYYVLNSYDYGVPQNRIRIYIIGFKDKTIADTFEIPKPKTSKLYLSDVICNSKIDNAFDGYFIFSDLRQGDSTIHSWDIIDTSQRQKDICYLLLKNRRKKIYGPLDGNPLSLDDFKSLDNSIRENELDELISLDILKKVGNKYDFKNSKISMGLNDIYRIFLPNSTAYPTLVASDTNDYVTNEMVYGTSKEEYKRNFIENVYKKNKYRKITKEEACLIQGFPKDYTLPENRSKWMKLIGNSVSVPVIDALLKNMLRVC